MPGRLVMHGELEILEVTKQLMAGSGFDVDTRSNSNEVFSRVELYKPGLILPDVRPGAIDERDICLALKSSSVTNKIPVVMFSAHSTNIEINEVCEADDCILKPLEAKNLVNTINKFFTHDTLTI